MIFPLEVIFQHPSVASISHVHISARVDRESTEIRMLVRCRNRRPFDPNAHGDNRRDPTLRINSVDCSVLGVVQGTVPTGDDPANVRERLPLCRRRQRGER